MMRALFDLLSPAGPRGRLQILIFHRVLPVPDPLFPGEMHAERFDEVCRWLRQWFNVLPLEEGARRLREGTLPARAAAITFDDGYADNHDIAMPILQRHGLTAAFFVATGFLDGGRMWNDTVIESIRRCPADRLDLAPLGLPGVGSLPLGSVPERQAAVRSAIGAIKYQPPVERAATVEALARLSGAQLPSDLMMRGDQVRGLRAGGMSIGAHTLTHPILAVLDRDAARAEIAGSRDALQALLDEPVTMFAYPNGKPGTDYMAKDAELVRELGFDTAVSTTWGAAHRRSDPHELPRFTPWDVKRSAYALRLARNLWSSRQAVVNAPR